VEQVFQQRREAALGAMDVAGRQQAAQAAASSGCWLAGPAPEPKGRKRRYNQVEGQRLRLLIREVRPEKRSAETSVSGGERPEGRYRKLRVGGHRIDSDLVLKRETILVPVIVTQCGNQQILSGRELKSVVSLNGNLSRRGVGEMERGDGSRGERGCAAPNNNCMHPERDEAPHIDSPLVRDAARHLTVALG